MNKLGKQVAATGISYAFLVFLVTGASEIFSDGDSFVTTAILANAIATAAAIAAWTGALFRRREVAIQPTDLAGWIGMFFVGALISAIFLYIDCGNNLPISLGGAECDGQPGISLVFTIAALSITAIALPSALRAWLTTKLA